MHPKGAIFQVTVCNLKIIKLTIRSKKENQIPQKKMVRTILVSVVSSFMDLDKLVSL